MVDKYKKLVPLIFLCLFGGKSLILGATWSDLGCLSVLAIASMWFEYFSNSREIDTLHKRMKLTDDHLTELYKKNEELRTYVSATKLGTSLRMGNGQGK